MTQSNSISSAPSAPISDYTLIIEAPVDVIAEELGGDQEAYLAAMALKFSHDRGEDARQQRNQLERHISDVQDEQIARMRDQADMLRRGGVLGAVGGALGGTLLIGSGAAGLADASPTARLLSGGAEVSKAFGTGAEGVANAQATDYAASAQGEENRAEAAERQLETVEDDIDRARELEADAFDFVDQIQETRAEAAKSVFIRG